MPELAMPASFPISLRMSPEPSSVEVQQDNNAIAADADNSDASQEQLTEAEDDSLEQQEEEQEQDDEAMPGGDDDTILDLDDAPHGETILQVCVVAVARYIRLTAQAGALSNTRRAARCSRSAQCCAVVC